MEEGDLNRKRHRLERLLRLRRILDRQARERVLRAASELAEARKRVQDLIVAIAEVPARPGDSIDHLANLRWFELLHEQLAIVREELQAKQTAYDRAVEARQRTWREVRVLETLKERVDQEARLRLQANTDRDATDAFLQRWVNKEGR